MTNFELVEPLIDLLDSEILKWKEKQVFPKYIVCNPLNLDIIVAMYKGIHVISDYRNTHLTSQKLTRKRLQTYMLQDSQNDRKIFGSGNPLSPLK